MEEAAHLSPSLVTLAWEDLRAGTHLQLIHTTPHTQDCWSCFLDWATGRASANPLDQHMSEDRTGSELGALSLNLAQIPALLYKLRKITSLCLGRGMSRSVQVACKQ